jgi:hypothetical protein
MKKKILFLLICILAVNFVLTSGCLTAREDISNAKTIMNNAKAKSEKINLQNDSYSMLHGEIHEIKIDYQSARSILANAKTTVNEDKVAIEFLTKKLNYNIQILDYLLSYADMKAHIQNSSRYIDSNNYSAAHNEISLARQDLTNAITFSKQAKITINSLDSSLVPLIDKGQYNRAVNFQYFTEPDNDVAKILDIIDNRIDAVELLDQANGYLSTNDFNSAKPYLVAAKTRFEILKENCDRLKNSQNYETHEMAFNLSEKVNSQILDIDQVLKIIPSSYSPISPHQFRITLPQLDNPLPLL